MENGVPYREVLEGLLARAKTEQRRSELQTELFGPPLPPALQYLWVTFARLRRRKGSNGFSLSPIEWSDVDAFDRLSGMHLKPWEIAIVEELDDLFLAEQNKANR